MSLQGYTGPPAQRYLTKCEKAVGHAHGEIAWASTFAPGVQAARQVPLPYSSAAAKVRPLGVARGVGVSTHVVVDRDALVSARTRTRNFVSSIIPRVQAGLRECDNIVQTDLQLPQASAGVQFVTARLRQLIPQYARMIQDSDRLVGDYARALLSVGGAGESMALVHSRAEAVRQETEAAMRRQLREVQDYAGNLRARAGRVTGDVTVLQRSTTTPATTTAVGAGGRTVAQQVALLTGQAANMRTAAGRMDNLVSDLTDAIGKSNRIFAEDADEVAGRDRQYANHARRLADHMDRLRKQFVALSLSISPDGTFNFEPLLSLDFWASISRELKLPQLANLLAGLGDCEQVRSLWDTLTPSQRQLLVTIEPMIIGNLDGIPIRYRASANNINIYNHLQDLNAQIAGLEGQLPLDTRSRVPAILGGLVSNPHQELRPRDVSVMSQLHELTSLRDTLQHLLNGPTYRFNANGDRVQVSGTHVVAFDPSQSNIITYHGEFGPTGDIPSHVRNIAIFVPGTGTSVSGFSGINNAGEQTGANARAFSLFDHANQLPGQGGETVMFGFGAGIFPQNIFRARDEQYAIDMGPTLANFGNSIRRHEDARTTLLGHSYGGKIVGASQVIDNYLRVDNIFHIASAGPGPGISSVAEYNGDAQVYAIVDDADFVNANRQLFGVPSPAHDPAATRLDAGPHGLNPISTHSSMFDTDCPGFLNMVAVITGNATTPYIPSRPSQPPFPMR
ncbi:MAG: alpha/beta hydrolase [Promicromonosporaceae bacterium]|nr:alpha/beta hydrolase [Promicromonosporaceae bacterium]